VRLSGIRTLQPEGSSAPQIRLPEDLGLRGCPPLTTGELAQIIGMSPTFIREEIYGGHLRAAVIGRGRKRVYRIPAREAYRYIKELGIL
jgi:hypothetical protein